MPVAIDTSVLIEAEKIGGDLARLIPENEEAVYVPALAAAEFLVGAHLPTKAHLRERARRLYDTTIRPMVESFEESHAAQLGALIAELRKSGKTMGFFDAAIAATVIARGDKLLALDDDFDRLKDRLALIKP